MKSKQTKATDISMKVKKIVWERDNHCCIVCGKTGYGVMPNAHYIPRSKGGLGIEQNIVTLCQYCHHRYDQTCGHNQIQQYIKNYLKTKYEDWEDYELTYKKYTWL